MTLAGDKLASVLEEVVWTPRPEQRRAKATWLAYLDQVVGGVDMTAAQVARITREPRIRTWWRDPDFVSWFENREEFRHRVEYIAHLALDAIEEILQDPKANANARIRAAQIVLEAGAKMPNARGEKFLDQAVSQMSEAQLRALITSRMPIGDSARIPVPQLTEQESTSEQPTSSRPGTSTLEADDTRATDPGEIS